MLESRYSHQAPLKSMLQPSHRHQQHKGQGINMYLSLFNKEYIPLKNDDMCENGR